MKVHVLVQRRNHFFIVGGRVETPDLVMRIDPLVLHDPKYVTPPLPAATDPTMHITAAVVSPSLKFM